MKNKKFIWIIVAVVLVAAISVAGTLAYLSATTAKVTNTFSARGLLDDDAHFKLWESPATADANIAGKYNLNTNETTNANSYKVVPGVDIAKDPYVFIDADALLQNAYLFVEVSSTLPDTLSWAMKDGDWTKIADPVGAKGTIYVYKEAVAESDADRRFYILDGNTIDVSTLYDGSAATTDPQLVFKAYLAQAAGFDGADHIAKATAAWGATFGAE